MEEGDDPLEELKNNIVNGNPAAYLLSTFSWDYASNKVTFWMEKSRLQQMVKDDWQVLVVRLDYYGNAAARATSLKNIV